VGGRLLDVYDAATGAGREMDGHRLGTRAPAGVRRQPRHAGRGAVRGVGVRYACHVEHRGLDQLPVTSLSTSGATAWILLTRGIATFPYSARRISRDISGSHPRTVYADAGAALDCCIRVFGFGPDQRMAEDGVVQEAEIAVGPARRDDVRPGGGARVKGPATLLIVHVDDVDALHKRVTDAGRGDPAQGRGLRARARSTSPTRGVTRWYFVAERRCLLTRIVVRTPPHTVRPNHNRWLIS